MDHTHCDSCVFSNCTHTECPVEYCENDCGYSLHRCKTDDHLKYICPEARVPCTNAVYGCEDKIKRKELLIHIEHCTASTIMCRFAHDRLSVNRLGVDETPSEVASLNTGRLLDEKVLLGDAEVLRSNKIADCSDELVSGAVNYTVEYGQAGKDEEEDCKLSMESTVGVITNASWSSRFHTQSLKPRVRTCSKMTAVISLNCVFHTHANFERYCCSFPCNGIVRRDEFATHWKSQHLDVQVCMPQIVRRCPMRGYGCTHGEVRLVPGPSGSSIDYDSKSDCFLVSGPGVILEDSKETSSDYVAQIQSKQELALYGYRDDFEESYDVLGQLPAEVLMVICKFLDSMSLWILSQVNRYFRKVCYNIVRKKGIVFYLWEYDKKTEKWSQGPKRWSFSKVFRHIPYWSPTDAPSMGHHMMSCEHLKEAVVPFAEAKVPLAVFHSKPDGKTRRIADLIRKY